MWPADASGDKLPPQLGGCRPGLAGGPSIARGACMTKVTDERALWLVRCVVPHEPALRAWLQGRQPPGLEVDDIVQETYARLIAADSVEQVRNIKNYTFQTAYSVIATHLRRAKVVSLQTMSNVEDLEMASPEPQPEQHAIGRDELQRLAEAIAALPGKVRDVFILRRVQGLSQREIAKRTGLAESTVEKHISRGILLMMDSFGRGGKAPPGASTQAGTKAKTEAERSHEQAEQSRD